MKLGIAGTLDETKDLIRFAKEQDCFIFEAE